jgi:hypothetical protein
MTLETILKGIYRKVQSFHNCGIVCPIWLQEQILGVYLMESDIDKGLQVLASGLQGERDALDQAIYKPYRGDVHG